MGSGQSSLSDNTSKVASAENLASASASSVQVNPSQKQNNDQQQQQPPPHEESGGGCPMKRSDGSYSYDWGALFRSNFPHRPGGSKPLSEEQINNASKTLQQTDTQAAKKGEGGGCPVKGRKGVEYNVYSEPIDPSNNMPFNPNQLPASIQSAPLSTDRVASSIPKGGGAAEKSTWIYPSPQMFYNALARKGKLQDTAEEEIESVVALHNNMNEKTWKKVLEWEETIMNDKENTGSKLLKFQGRPTDLSPKAAFKHYILGHPLPFDRHDWTIERPDGTVQRYVIDYYHDESRARDTPDTALPDKDDIEATPSLLVDVRPGIDNPTALWHRMITMPYARHVTSSTNFEPLPMTPTANMQSQVKESVAVWQNIQQQAAAKKDRIHDQTPSEKESMTEKQAKELAALFATMRKDCIAAQSAVAKCTNDEECAKASIDLTMCMGKIICPLQHQVLVKSIVDNDVDDSSVVETALTRVSDCVQHRTHDHRIAKELYPNHVR